MAVYTTYIPGIYCLLGGYRILTTYYQNQNNPTNILSPPVFQRSPRFQTVEVDLRTVHPAGIGQPPREVPYIWVLHLVPLAYENLLDQTEKVVKTVTANDLGV